MTVAGTHALQDWLASRPSRATRARHAAAELALARESLRQAHQAATEGRDPLPAIETADRHLAAVLGDLSDGR